MPRVQLALLAALVLIALFTLWQIRGLSVSLSRAGDPVKLEGDLKVEEGITVCLGPVEVECPKLGVTIPVKVEGPPGPAVVQALFDAITEVKNKCENE